MNRTKSGFFIKPLSINELKEKIDDFRIYDKALTPQEIAIIASQ